MDPKLKANEDDGVDAEDYDPAQCFLRFVASIVVAVDAAVVAAVVASARATNTFHSYRFGPGYWY